jgi:hypothetical protein
VVKRALCIVVAAGMAEVPIHQIGTTIALHWVLDLMIRPTTKSTKGEQQGKKRSMSNLRQWLTTNKSLVGMTTTTMKSHDPFDSGGVWPHGFIQKQELQ